MSLKLVSCLGVSESPVIREEIEKFAECLFLNPLPQDFDIAPRIFEKSEALIVGGRVKLSRQILEKFANLRLIVVMAIGTDNIDLAAATELKIIICSTPACSVEEVADSTLSLILNLYRHTFQMGKMVSNGIVFSSSDMVKAEMKGKARRMRGQTLGIVGFGNIGQSVALRAKVFGFRCVFYDPIQHRGVEKALGVERCESVEEILSISDIISLHCPLIPKTRHIINDASIGLMKDGARFVNTSRGPLVDEEALARALKSGKLIGAGLDVHETEPYNSQSGPLKDVPNLLCTPHSSWYSDDSDLERKVTAVEEVKRGLTGNFPNGLYFAVNKLQ